MGDSGLGKVYADGEIIVRQGDIGDCMFTVQQGQLEILAERPGGDPVRLGIMSPGDIFGEMAIFENEVRSATVRALGEARVLTIDKRTFLRRVQEDPSLAFNLVRMMSRRIRRLTDRVEERRRGAERRVAARVEQDRRAST
jgi:CRP-like cAMP-binding protein